MRSPVGASRLWGSSRVNYLLSWLRAYRSQSSSADEETVELFLVIICLKKMQLKLHLEKCCQIAYWKLLEVTHGTAYLIFLYSRSLPGHPMPSSNSPFLSYPVSTWLQQAYSNAFEFQFNPNHNVIFVKSDDHPVRRSGKFFTQHKSSISLANQPGAKVYFREF